MAFFILSGEEQKGPFSKDELRSLLDQGLLESTALGWTEGQAEWRPIAELLRGETESSAPPPAEPDSPQPPTQAAPETGEESDEAGMASPRQLALLAVYGIEHAPRITKEVALALLQQRDLSKPVTAAAWQEFQRRFPPSTKRRTRSERIEWLLAEILEEHDTSYWTPDEEAVREILEYLDHRYKGWEMRVNSYDLIDRGIRAFYPPPTKQMLEHEEAKKSIVVEMRHKRARKAHFLEGLGISLILVGLFLGWVFGSGAIKHQDWENILGFAGGMLALTLGIRAFQVSRRVQQR